MTESASDGRELLIVAGEASGDLHAARLLAELAARSPGLRAFGLGGDELEAAGCRRLADSAEISVVGIAEVLKILPRAKQIFRQILDEVDALGTRTAVLVDFPEFNLRLARELRQRDVRVIYYISPQIWAWRRRRVRAIARDVDLMLTLFPFEVDFYRGHGVDARHVGHPLVDEVPELPQLWDRLPAVSGEPAVVALLPGSRRSEVRSLLPTMLATVRRMAAEWPISARLIQAPTVPTELFDELLDAPPTPGLELERIRRDRFVAIAGSHLALCASGTATLEVSLLGTPMMVLYRLKWSSYVLAKLLVDLPYFSMPNLVLRRPVVPELLQGQTDPQKAAARALELLADPPAIAAMRSGMGEIRSALGEGGASGRAAAAVLEAIEGIVP